MPDLRRILSSDEPRTRVVSDDALPIDCITRVRQMIPDGREPAVQVIVIVELRR